MLFDELEQQRADISRHLENSARLAQCFAKFETTGQGSVEFDKRVNFDLTFIEQPYMTYGCEIELEPLPELYEANAAAAKDELDDTAVTSPEYQQVLENYEHAQQSAVASTPPLPSASGFITEWDTDERGFYTGVWLAVSVYFPYHSGIASDVAIYMRHHFTFSGKAMKDIPIDVRD